MEPTALESLLREIDTLLILLDRPVVRIQIFVLLGGIALSWVIAWIIRRLFIRKRIYAAEQGDFNHTFYTFADITAFPILAIILIQLAIGIFALLDQPSGFLEDAQPLLLIFLLYEICLGGLYSRYPADVIELIHDYIFWPLFLVSIVYIIVNNFLNFALIQQIPIISALGVDITVGRIIQVLIILYIFGTASFLLQRAIERATAERTIERAYTASIIIVVRYIVIAIGIVVLGLSLGINAAALAVIGGGLSIGIGFGLQQIVANFISGLLLLFEQSLRPGDVIELNGQLGVVRQVNIRSTTIITNDNVEIIVPNERFLTTEVTTYTRTSPKVRVAVDYGIGYNMDPKFARDLVLKTVVKHGNVLSNPAPDVQFVAFGASSLDFRVLVWMDKPIQTPRFKSDINFMIWEAFAKHEIEIPFPQTDLHLRTGWEVLSPRPPEEDEDNGDSEPDLPG